MSEADVTVTLKYDKGFEAPWGVFRGSVGDVRANLLAYFELHPDIVSALSLHELVSVCSDLAHGKSHNLSVNTLVAAPIADGASVPKGKESLATPAAEDNEDPWASAGKAQGKPEPGPNPMLALIESCANVDALKKLWAANQASFADSSVMDAWKTKGKSLQKAAA